jgi:hypothetical protein
MSENQKALSAEQSLPPRTELTAHTPGPWQVGLSADNTPAVCVPVHKGFGSGFVIAHINRLGTRSGASGCADANARLITAAPDMLNALRKIVNFGGNDSIIRETAIAAIRKATGAP